MGFGPTVIYALHKWLISIFSKTVDAFNQQIHIDVVPEGVYILMGNNVIGYF